MICFGSESGLIDYRSRVLKICSYLDLGICLLLPQKDLTWFSLFNIGC